MTYGTPPAIYAPIAREGDAAAVVPATVKAGTGRTSATEDPPPGRSLATGLSERVAANEKQIQEAVWDYLNKCAIGGLNKVGGVVAFHPKNGGPQQATAGQRLSNARQGVVTGVPDLILWHGRQMFWLELKTLRGELSAAQQSMAHIARCNGINTACAYGIDEACAILRRWGLTKGEVQ